MSVLSQILADKRTEVHCSSKRITAEELQEKISSMSEPRDFAAALLDTSLFLGPGLIAEVKKASPSKGVIREDFDPVEIAKIYANNGASCLSVLTDEPYFQGKLSYLSAIRDVVDLPLLRKDFIISDYQLLEARAAGADAILLIVAALTAAELKDLLFKTDRLGMQALVEIHDADELKFALDCGANILGINNRDLHTFRTSLQVTLDLFPLIPSDKVTISESGINSHEDFVELQRAGVNAILVGESLMREADIASKMHSLLGR